MKNYIKQQANDTHTKHHDSDQAINRVSHGSGSIRQRVVYRMERAVWYCP